MTGSSVKGQHMKADWCFSRPERCERCACCN